MEILEERMEKLEEGMEKLGHNIYGLKGDVRSFERAEFDPLVESSAVNGNH
jgi:hypothetical protein